MFRLANVVILVLLVSSVAWADDDWDDGYPGYYVERVYVPQRVVEYVPVETYYAPPSPLGIITTNVLRKDWWEVWSAAPWVTNWVREPLWQRVWAPLPVPGSVTEAIGSGMNDSSLGFLFA